MSYLYFNLRNISYYYFIFKRYMIIYVLPQKLHWWHNGMIYLIISSHFENLAHFGHFWAIFTKLLIFYQKLIFILLLTCIFLFKVKLSVYKWVIMRLKPKKLIQKFFFQLILVHLGKIKNILKSMNIQYPKRGQEAT